MQWVHGGEEWEMEVRECQLLSIHSMVTMKGPSKAHGTKPILGNLYTFNVHSIFPSNGNYS